MQLKWGRLKSLILIVTLVTGCSLDPARDFFSLSIRVHDQTNHSELKLLSDPTDPPASINDVNCFGVNVNGSGIDEISGAASCYNTAMPKPGIVSGFKLVSDGNLEVKVPGGSERTIRLLVIKSNSLCPTMQEVIEKSGIVSESTRPYEVAKQTLDILSDTSIDLTAVYSSSTASTKSWFCNNDAPTITAISAQATAEDTATSSISFTIGDKETPISNLTVTGSSSNTALVSGSGLAFSGTGATRTLVITPVADKYGTTTITVTVSDGAASTSASFVLTVNSDGYLAAYNVIGQTSFTESSSGTTSQILNGAQYVSSDGTNLFVSDRWNHRVLIWNSIPTTMGQAADQVLGQTDYVSSTSGTSAIKFNQPFGVASDGTNVAMADLQNNRVLLWTSIPTTNTAAAKVIGQNGFTTNTPNVFGPISTYGAQDMYYPTGVALGSNKLLVADSNNNRVLIYNSVTSIPTNAGSASYVIGQTSLTSGGGTACTSQGLSAPYDVATDGTRVAIADRDNNRVMLYNSIPTSSNVAADVVIGQTSFTSCAQNQGGSASASTLSMPISVSIGAGGRVYVSDNANNRVLIWNSFPTSNGQAADQVIGQVNFTGTSGGGPTSELITYPSGLFSNGTNLFLSTNSHNRVLQFTYP